jgi:hypothetical protein
MPKRPKVDDYLMRNVLAYSSVLVADAPAPTGGRRWFTINFPKIWAAWNHEAFRGSFS